MAPAAGEERGEGAAAAPGAGRRFASLLVSKLVGRSTPNLQDAAGSLGTSSAAAAAGAADAASEHSDAESDAGSEWTAITSTSRLTTATEAPAAAAAAAAAAGGPASRAAGGAGSSGGGGGAKAITLASACQCVASLAALQARLRDLAGRSQALQQQLAAGLEPRQRRRQQDAALAALGAEAEGCRRRADEAQRELAELRAAAAGNRKLATVRAQALVTSLKVMQGADRRVG